VGDKVILKILIMYTFDLGNSPINNCMNILYEQNDGQVGSGVSIKLDYLPIGRFLIHYPI